MNDTPHPGIYLIIEFDGPEAITKEHAQNAARLHSVTQNKDWIKEVVAGSGGIGTGPCCIWIFWLENYAALDRLLQKPNNEVSQAYHAFFNDMPVVQDKIREKVVFL